MGPIDLLAAQYNLSPAAISGLAQYASPKMSMQVVDPNEAAANANPFGMSNGSPPAPPPLPPNADQGPTLNTFGLPNVGSQPVSPAAAQQIAALQDPNSEAARQQSLLNYTPNVPQASVNPIRVAPPKPGELGSGSHIVRNPDRVDSPYGGADPDAPAAPVAIKVASAGWSPSTRGGQVHEGYRPDELGGLKEQGDKVLSAEESAMKSRQVLAQQAALGDATYKATYADAMQKYADDAKINEENRRAFVEDQTKRLSDFTTRVSATENPDQIWGDGAGAVLAKIGAAIAVATGAFGSAFTKGPNFAKEIIDGQINRSIQAQRENVSNARAGYEAQSNLYAKGLAEFKDRDMANLATRLNMTNATLAEIDKISSQEGLPEAQNAALQQLRGQYEKDKLDLDGRWVQMAHSQYVNTYQDKYLPAQYAMTGGGGGGKKKGGGEGKSGGDLVPGFGQAQSEHDARELNKEFAFASQVDEKLSEIKALQEKAKGLSSLSLDTILPGKVSELGQVQDRISQLKLEVVERTAKLRGIRRMDQHMQDQIAGSLGLDGAESLRGNSDQKIEAKQRAIDAARETLKKNRDIEARQYGVRSGGEVYVIDPTTGRPKPVTKLEGRTPQPLLRQRDASYAADSIEPDEGD
jgi:hypothetical protein